MRISVINRPSMVDQGLSCIGAEELDHRHMRMLLQLRIARIESNHLGAHHRAVDRRHDPEPAAMVQTGMMVRTGCCTRPAEKSISAFRIAGISSS